MADARDIAVLNDLLAATLNSPLVHLADSAMFLTSAGSEEVEALQRMMAEEKAHASAIAELMLELGQAPRPAPPDAHAGDLHYLEFHYLLPIMTRAKESLVAVHASARTRLAGSPRALELVTRLEAAQRRHLEMLRTFQAAAPAATAG